MTTAAATSADLDRPGTLWLDEAELVPVDIGAHHRTGAGVADVEPRSAEREEVIERGLHETFLIG
jgi:hypothetical protein